MAVIKVEEFRGDHNKLYLVAGLKNDDEFIKIAKSRFKVANKNLKICSGWVFGDDLYLIYPAGIIGLKARFVRVAYVIC